MGRIVFLHARDGCGTEGGTENARSSLAVELDVANVMGVELVLRIAAASPPAARLSVPVVALVIMEPSRGGVHGGTARGQVTELRGTCTSVKPFEPPP